MQISMDCVHSLLWAPHISESDLDALVRRAWVDDHWHHIVPTGGSPNLRGISLNGGGSRPAYAYLPEAIIERLQTHGASISHQTNVAGSLAAPMLDSYTRTSVKIHEFGNLQAAREFLKFEQPRWNKELIFDPTHAAGLRPVDLASALHCLRTLKFVEVIGPTGFGKSAFIQELLVKLLNAEEQKYDVLSCVIVRQHSVWDSLQQLARESGHLEEDRIKRLAEDNLFRELAGYRLIYWIKDYDRASQQYVRALANKLRQSAKDHRAFWVIESMVAPDSLEVRGPSLAGQVKLGPLDNQALTNILKKQPSDNRRRDINAVVNEARGNRHYAIMRWATGETNHTLSKSTRLDKYELYQAQLNPDEVFVFKSIAYLLSQSPLETTTLRLVEEYCQTLPRFTQSHARRVIRGVIEKAAEWGLISVEVFGREESW